MLLLNEEIFNLWQSNISSSMSYLLSQMLSFFPWRCILQISKTLSMFFPVYILIQISFTELWEVLCNKEIKQLMDEAEHDIRIILIEKCFILRKPHPINAFLFIQSISNYKTSLPWARKFQSSWRYCLILVSFVLWLGSRL